MDRCASLTFLVRIGSRAILVLVLLRTERLDVAFAGHFIAIISTRSLLLHDLLPED